jgi:hypothetical protein
MSPTIQQPPGATALRTAAMTRWGSAMSWIASCVMTSW